MPSTFRILLRNLISSLVPVMAPFSFDASSKAAPIVNGPMPIVVWVQLNMALMRPWSSDSQAVWAELLGYRISRVYICKNNMTDEHEYVVVDLGWPGRKNRLFLRLERSTGERRETNPSSSTIPSIESYRPGLEESSYHTSPNFYQRKSSGLSTSSSSVKGGRSKVPGPVHRDIYHRSNSSSTDPPGPDSSPYLAIDTVEKLNGVPRSAKIIRTIELNSNDQSKRPSLWDLMILTYVMRDDSAIRKPSEGQSFWFADTISAILETWSKTGGDIAVIDGKPIRSRFLKRRTSPGVVEISSFHRRDSDLVDKIWTKFLKQREELSNERYEYEATRTAETRRTEELKRQVKELEKQLEDRERQFQQQLSATEREWGLRLKQSQGVA